MKALITGINGFVGQYLRKELIEHGHEVIGMDVQCLDQNDYTVNILNFVEVKSMIQRFDGECIFHLAGQASVAKSWLMPQKTMELNVIGTLNLLEAVRTIKPHIKILLVGSSDQYGIITEEQCPIKECEEQNPVTPYAVSKCTQERIGVMYEKVYGLSIYMTRSFNHIGVGQLKGYVIPDLASGIVEIEAGRKSVLRIGNLEPYRDMTNVKDIVSAYRLIIEKGTPGKVYNVGSGKSYQIRELLNILIAMSTADICVEEDIQKMRVTDTLRVQCDHSMLTQDTGWQPKFSIEKTLEEILMYYRKQIYQNIGEENENN